MEREQTLLRDRCIGVQYNSTSKVLCKMHQLTFDHVISRELVFNCKACIVDKVKSYAYQWTFSKSNEVPEALTDFYFAGMYRKYFSAMKSIRHEIEPHPTSLPKDQQQDGNVQGANCSYSTNASIHNCCFHKPKYNGMEIRIGVDLITDLYHSLCEGNLAHSTDAQIYLHHHSLN